MLAKERQLYILSRLKTKPMISINDLCREMKVSKSTVQRDLILLEEQGKLDRARGGAAQVGLEETISDLTEKPVLEKVNVNLEAKKSIAESAAGEIKDGDLIFLDSGTTPLQLIPFLYNKQIKIVTNSFLLLSQLNQLSVEVYMLGGKYSSKHQICLGPSTIEQINDFRFDKAFIGANGADSKLAEVYTSELEVGGIKKAAIKRSKHSFLLIDDSKFQLTGLSLFGYFEDFDKIFTNNYPTIEKKPKNMVITNGGK